MNDGTLDELYIVARYLVDEDENATFADLLIAYFGYITGVDYSDALGTPPDDENIIRMHIDGLTPSAIAFWLNDDEDYIRWVLIQYGFSPFTGGETVLKFDVEREKYKELIRDGTFA